MALTFPQTCYAGLVGINGACTVPEIAPVMYLDMVPRMSIDNLGRLSTPDYPTGEKVGLQIIENASRFITADVLSIYDAAYKVIPSLVTGCSACSFTSNSSSGAQLGTMVKNTNSSKLARLVITGLRVKIASTGTYTVVLTDGITSRTFQYSFTSGVELEVSNINYSTREKSIRIYMLEEVPLMRLTCPSGSGCGCSGKAAHQSDLVFTGTAAGSETQQAYGFIPCAHIGCNGDDLLCSIAQQAPNMVAQTMLYKSAEIYYQWERMSGRNTAIKNATPEEVLRDERHFAKQYNDKLKGVGIRGLRDVVNDLLRQNPDACIQCDAKFQTGWATG